MTCFPCVYCNTNREIWSDNQHLKRLVQEKYWKAFEKDSPRMCDGVHESGADWVASHVQTLACSCPPLIDYKGGMAIGSLIHELTTSCASRVSSLLSVPYSQSIDWIRDCTGILDIFLPLSSIKAQHEQERRAMALGMALFVSGDFFVV